MAKHYVNNRDLFNAIVESKAKGELTPDAIKMLETMIKEISKIFKYKIEEDRQDCQAFAMEDIIKYWNRFDPAQTNNAFSYFTTMTKHGMSKGLRRLYPIKACLKVSISEDAGVYNF